MTDLLQNNNVKLIHPGYNKMYSTLNWYVDINNIRGMCREVAYKCQREKNYKKIIIFPKNDSRSNVKRNSLARY